MKQYGRTAGINSELVLSSLESRELQRPLFKASEVSGISEACCKAPISSGAREKKGMQTFSTRMVGLLPCLV